MKLPIRQDSDGACPTWYDADGEYISYEDITAFLNGGYVPPASKLTERIAELEGFVPDHLKQEQKHLDEGTVERDYWHYGYLMALRDLLGLISPHEPKMDQADHSNFGSHYDDVHDAPED